MNNTNNQQQPEQHNRYSRQVRFTPLGQKGQQHLTEATVLIVGAGALGSSSAETLVRAGVGKVIIADRDYVEWSNLQRQQLFTEQDAQDRMPKAIAAQRRLQQINSDVTIEAHMADVTADEMNDLAKGVDLIMDATDNFETRLMINDISQKYNIPWIYGGCVGSYGITFTIIPGITPCLQCLMESAPLGGDTCDTSGIIPPAVQMVVAHQCTEAIKLLSGNTDQLRGTLLSFDLWNNEQVSIKMNSARKPNCPSCGSQPTYPHLTQAGQSKTEVLCGRDTVQIRPAQKMIIDLEQTAQRLAKLEENQVSVTPFLVSMIMPNEQRFVIFRDGRVMVHGTKDIAEARTLYHRYFG
ncbi:MoeB/ThiF family adenylyltransferase [Paenibacillus sp. KACC 21273]|uniref:MoeB/ThiF family adenylyltransferase n=1 Tax=Paenibacillus sp. KACC 21273 TaxID=3025665 RepID=UPI002365D016|nr:MoeB/ThiF family adenylyltransferase [Paenibacillus sp. KACC 21273]WDF52785.1 MoeB/ThiF family adenylyltransferase [Paenibacillus sp. KACC 21273]